MSKGPAHRRSACCARPISAESVAAELGFSTPSRFSFSLRRATGGTPAASAHNEQGGCPPCPYRRRRIRVSLNCWRSRSQRRIESIQGQDRGPITLRAAGHPDPGVELFGRPQRQEMASAGEVVAGMGHQVAVDAPHGGNGDQRRCPQSNRVGDEIGRGGVGGLTTAPSAEMGCAPLRRVHKAPVLPVCSTKQRTFGHKRAARPPSSA